MTTSLYHDAMAHHIWATERLIDVCAELSPEQLRATVPGTYGPIIATLHHLVSTDGWYLTFFRDWTNLVEEDAELTLDELRAAITANGAAWMAYLSAELDGEQDIPERGEGWIFHSPLGFRLAQVIHHGTDHRCQVCTGLTSLGIEPPEVDLWAYGQATGRSRGEDLRPA
ncbi:MAG: DinB family protein [Candidatus Limnocylindrales bacterium]